jgi:hypothetical protein
VALGPGALCNKNVGWQTLFFVFFCRQIECDEKDIFAAAQLRHLRLCMRKTVFVL